MTAEKYPKRYKLLRDLPTLKAGAIFKESQDKGVWTCDDTEFKRRYYFSEKDLHHNPDWFEKIYEEENWKPKDGEQFYFIHESGKIVIDSWEDNYIYEYLYHLGNCFKTEEAANCCLKNFIKPAFKKYHELQRSNGAEC